MPPFPGTTGRQYLFAEIRDYLVEAACPPAWQDTIAAIAWPESGGISNNLNDNPATGDFSVGWFQINYYGDLLAGRTALYGTPQELAQNPLAQAKAAVDILGGGPGITAWTGDPIGQQAVDLGGPVPWSQIIATFERDGVPVSWYETAVPPLPPVHPPIPPIPKEYEDMALTAFEDSRGVVHCFGVSSKTPGHLLHFTITNGKWSVDDGTDELLKVAPTAGPYTVEP